MTSIRRIYAYLLTFVGLAIVSVAAANLGQLLVDVLLQPAQSTAAGAVRDSVAQNAAAALVGLVAWALHWTWLVRSTRDNDAERASALRRLFMYAVLAGSLAVLCGSLRDSVQALVGMLLDPRLDASRADALLRPLPFIVIAATVWLAHFRQAQTDRDRVGQHGASATLRRWYVYGAALVGWLALLVGLSAFVGAVWRTATSNGVSVNPELADSSAIALVGLAIWIGHWRSLPRQLNTDAVSSPRHLPEQLSTEAVAVSSPRHLPEQPCTDPAAVSSPRQRPEQPSTDPEAVSSPQLLAQPPIADPVAVWSSRLLPWRLNNDALFEDGASVLRTVYLFLGLSAAVLGTLWGASQLLYFAVARALGVDDPGGVRGNLLQAAAEPGSACLVFGAAWLYQRAALRHHAHRPQIEAPRQAGIRRLYTYITSLAGLHLVAAGVAGLLWTLADMTLSQTDNVAWREQVSLFATLAVVGLPVWMLHWRARVEASEAQSLARRLYLYISLIVAALVLIGSAAAALYLAVRVALGASFETSLALDLTHALALATVAVSIAAYHWHVIRAETAATPASAASSEAVVRIQADDPASLQAALDALRATGVRVSPR